MNRGRCDGSAACEASPHIHGCFADFGDCDDHIAHLRSWSPSPSRCESMAAHPAGKGNQ